MVLLRKEQLWQILHKKLTPRDLTLRKCDSPTIVEFDDADKYDMRQIP